MESRALKVVIGDDEEQSRDEESVIILDKILKDERSSENVEIIDNRSQMNEISKSPILLMREDIDGSRGKEDFETHQRTKLNFSEDESSVADYYEDRNSILRRKNFSHHRKATGMTRRCVCNLSQCASMNYMCKSERQILEDGTELEPGCFIEELDSSDASSGSVVSPQGTGVMTESNGRVTSARRGCIEMLSREKEELCRSESGDPIHCCFNEDMCNYAKTFYPPVSPSLNQNHGPINRLPYEPGGIGRGGLNGNMDHQVWLRAAVIAVPVCGLLILIVLIYVARRLLNGDDDYKETSSAQSMLSGGGRKSSRLYNGHNTPKPCELLLPAPPALDGYHVAVNGTHPQQQPCYWCSVRPGPTTLLLPTHSIDSSSFDSVDPYPLTSPWNMYADNESQMGSIGSEHVHGHSLENPNIQVPDRKRKFPFLNWKFGQEESSSCNGNSRPCHNV